MKIWAPDDETLSSTSSGWMLSEYELNPDGSGTACAISLTRETEGAVRQFLNENPGHFRRLLVATLTGGASPRAITSGAHANHLAEHLASKIAADRTLDLVARRERYHLFISAPNAFMFYFGRQASLLKPLTLYEFDFDFQADGSYRPSLSYPEISSALS